MSEFLCENFTVVLFVLHSVSDVRGFFLQEFFLVLIQFLFPLSYSVQNTVQGKHSFRLISLDLKASLNVTLHVNEVLVQIAVIITGAVEDSFDFSFFFLDSDHFETIFEQSVLFNIIKDVFAECLKFGDDLVISFFTLLNELFSGDVTKFELYHGFCSFLFSSVEYFCNLFFLL